MRRPKKPKTFRYPRLYWTDAVGQIEIIIIYPDGKSERTYAHGKFEEFTPKPCWAYNRDIKSPWYALELMKDYAKMHGFRRIFIGEVK